MTKSVSVQRARRTSNRFHTAFSLLLIISFLVAGAALPAARVASAAPVSAPATPAAAGLVCESFNGYTPGSTIGSYTGWYDAGSGPVVTAGNGVAGTVGLAPATNIFNWTAHPFNWNAVDFQSVSLQMDYQTDANSAFDDDRVAWTIDGASVDSANQFGVQSDNADGGIVTYWRKSDGTRVQTPIAALPTLTANTWYRLRANITKLTATSAKIDVSFVQLDGSGNPTGTVTTGSVADTSTWSGGAPATRYFTATSMWPSYKNYTAAGAPADNACYQLVTGAAQRTLTVNVAPVGGGSVTKNPDKTTYSDGESVQLTPVPAAGYVFSNWSGSLTGNANPATLVMDADKTVTANFVPAAGLVCESFNGYTPGSTIGSYTGWYDAGSGPTVTAGNGVASSTGLAPATSIFNWTAHSFNWNAVNFQSVSLQMDYQTDANKAFDDDRVAWTIDGASVDSTNQFGVQLDNADGGIVTYWRKSDDARVQTPIAALPTLTANTWYRLRADITKLTATSAKIDVSFVQLDGSGNPTGTVTTGSVADTSTWSGGAPATRYFTATSMWPSYKNFTTAGAPADNTCYQVVSASVGQPPNQPTLVAPVDATTVQTLSPNLTVQVSDPDSAALSVSFYGREVGAGSGADFSIIALPDTQFYSESYPGTFTAQTQWIANSRTSQNIVYVAHEGDIVNVAGTVGQWINADAAMNVLDAAGIPYGVVPGNHDDGDGGTNYNAYFGVGRFCTNYPTDCRSYYGGSYPAGKNDSNYTLFSAGGMDFIVVNLEYASPPADLLTTWADGLLKTYSSRRAIVVSHDILSVAGAFDAWGQQIYNELKDNPNLFLMLCGHNHGESRRTDPGTDGHIINSVLADYQSYPNGGSGYLRMMQFSPANNEIRFKTYSPTLNAYETDASSEFVLPYNMDGTGPFTLLGTVNGVTSGHTASWNWPNLKSGTMYEWHVTVSDDTSTITGPTWSFTTAALPKAPTGLAIVDAVPTPNDVRITWTEVTEDVKSHPTTIITYQVYGSQDPYFTPSGSPLGAPTATSFDHTGILPTTINWYYVVRAVNAIGASDSDPVATKRVAKFTFGLTPGQ